MAFHVAGVVFPRTEVRDHRRAQDLGARNAGVLEVLVEVVDEDVERLCLGAQSPRTRHAFLRPNRAKHDDVRSEAQLGVADRFP